MKKLGRILFSLLKMLVILSILLVVALDVFCEFVGIPPAAVRRWEETLAERGWPVDIGQLRVGVVRGVVAEDVVLYLDEAQSVRLARAAKLHIRADLGRLVRREIVPREVSVSGASLLIPQVSEGKVAAGSLLAVRQIDGSFGIGDTEVTFDNLNAVIRGVMVQIGGNLTLAEQQRTRLGRGEGGAGLNHVVCELVGRYQATVERFSSLMDEAHFAEGDAHLELSVQASLSDPASSSASGRLRVSDAVIRGLGIRQLLSSFTYSEGALNLSGCKVVLSQDEIIDAELSLYPDRREFSGRASGTLSLASIRCVCPVTMRKTLAGVELEGPVAFDVALARSGYAPQDWLMEGTVASGAFRFRGISFTAVSGKLNYGDGRISATDLALHARGPGGPEKLQGQLDVWLAEHEVAGELRGRCAILQRVVEAGGLSARMGTVFRASPAAWEFALERSPLAWREWRGKGAFALDVLRVGQWTGRDLAGTVALDKGHVRVAELSLKGAGDLGATLNGELSVDASRPVKDDKVAVTFAVDIAEAIGDVAPPGTAALKLSGKFELQPCARRMSGRAHGNVYPVRFYNVLREPLRLPESRAVARVACSGPPPFVSLVLPETPWDLNDWKVDGEVSAQDFRYDTLDVEKATAKLELSSSRVAFRDIAFTERKGAEVTLDVEVDLEPVRVTISGRMKGDPRFIEVFIGAEKGKRIYRAIWEHAAWLPGGEPVIILDSLQAGDGPQRGDWWLQMAGHLEVENVIYRELELDRLQMDVNLNLPRLVSVDNIVATRRGQDIKGDVRIRFGGLAAYEFALEGICEPKEIVRTVNPRWETFLSDFTFAPNSEVECHGAFFYGKEPLLHLKGSLKAPSAQYKSFKFDEVAADWQINESTIGWHVSKGNLHGGIVGVRGFFDTSSGTGLMALDAKGIGLDRLAKQFGAKDTGRKIEGKLEGSCQVQMLRSWGAQPLQLTGSGRLVLSEGNLWNVPFLYQLGQVLDLTLISRLSAGRASGLGRISMLEADLDFKGQKLVVPTLSTDGSLFSLAGQGEYRWSTKELNFKVKGETLKKVGLLRLALKPLSWVFDARLTGTVNDHKWALKTPLQRVFSGKDEPILDLLD